jgi:hypothetical protein
MKYQVFFFCLMLERKILNNLSCLKVSIQIVTRENVPSSDEGARVDRNRNGNGHELLFKHLN